MKKITLLVLTMLFSVITFAQVFPTLSNGAPGTETWYYIQFERPGGGNQGVIQDMGENSPLLTKKARETTDSQLWKVTGTPGNYVITNKQGRSIDWNGSRYTAVTAGTLALAIDLDNNATYEGFEIKHPTGGTEYMNQDGGGGFERQLGQFDFGDLGNVLNFRLPADVVGGLDPQLVAVLPTIGVSYHIKFRVGNGVIQDNGDGNLVQTAIPLDGETSQLWKVSGTPGDYTITSDNGNILDFDGTNFTATTTSTTKFALIENLPGWELQRVGSTDAMNQFGGPGYGKDLGEWTVADPNNPLEFVEPANIGYAPKLSGGGTDYWYYIQFTAADLVVEDKGDDALLLMADGIVSDSQLWKATGTIDAFTLTNKASGRTINYDAVESRYTASSTNSVPFKLIANLDGSAFNLQRDGSSQGLNQFGGPVVDAQLGDWAINNANNLLSFVAEGNLLSTNKVTDDVVANVYPNPFTDYFHFNVKKTASKNASLKVYAITGKLVKSEILPLNKGEVAVDARSLSRGMYIVQIETAEGKSSFKMIKQ